MTDEGDRIDAEAFMCGLGREIRAQRSRRGWKQAELAERVPRLTATGVSELENGRGNPGIARVLHIADAFGIPSAELIALAFENARIMAEQDAHRTG